MLATSTAKHRYSRLPLFEVPKARSFRAPVELILSSVPMEWQPVILFFLLGVFLRRVFSVSSSRNVDAAIDHFKSGIVTLLPTQFHHSMSLQVGRTRS